MTKGMTVAAPFGMEKVFYFFKFFFRCALIFGIQATVPASPYRGGVHIRDILTKIAAADGGFAGWIKAVSQIILRFHERSDLLLVIHREIAFPIVLITQTP